MIPVITDDVQVERLSIYNQAVLPRNPLNGARVRNTTGKHLLQGPVTVLDGGAYAGDARIDDVPPGQERLLSYGVDQQVIVDATKNREESAIQTGKIVKGVLEITNKQVFTQEYLNENKSDKDKTLLIEHPVRQGWKLVEPAKADESTEAVYRFKGKVPAGKQSKLAVRQEIITGQQIAILPCDIGQLEFYARTGEIPKTVRDALAKAITLKYAMVDTQRQIEQRQQRINQTTQEQTRIRENMKTVAANSEYYTRLLKKLDEQETQIEKLQGEITGLQQKLQAQQKELEDYLAGLNVG
jgi:cell division protein FtsL